MSEEKKNKYEITEVCPHCEHENTFVVDEDVWTSVCAKCGNVITLCDKCAWLHPNAEDRKCDDCLMCDLANFMNYLKGGISIEKYLSSLNPSLTDMTSGLKEGQESTFDNYFNDVYGDDVLWDVKYWDIYRMVKECFLNKDSSEKDCLEFVSEIVKRNKE